MSSETELFELCNVERRILHTVRERGEVVGRVRLALELGRGYRWTLECIKRLERRGLIVITHTGPGRPDILRSIDEKP